MAPKAIQSPPPAGGLQFPDIFAADSSGPAAALAAAAAAAVSGRAATATSTDVTSFVKGIPQAAAALPTTVTVIDQPINTVLVTTLTTVVTAKGNNPSKVTMAVVPTTQTVLPQNEPIIAGPTGSPVSAMSKTQGQMYSSNDGKDMGTTEHIIIGAVSVAITLIVILIGAVLYRFHTGKTKFDRFLPRRRQQSREIQVSAPTTKWTMPPSMWPRKNSSASEWTTRDLPAVPVPSTVFTRRDSLKEKAVPLGSNPFLSDPNSRPTTPKFAADTLFATSKAPFAERSRNDSLAPGSAAMLNGGVARTLSRYTDSSDTKTVPFFFEYSQPTYSTQPTQILTEENQPTQPLRRTQAPPPQQQTQPTPQERASASTPEVSRFSSWTNSVAPQTPRNLNQDQRYSSTTARSSLPRYRTVESWVQQQSGRIEAQQLKDMLREGESGTTEPVPDVPKKYRVETDSVATVFRVHPGTEVVIDRGSRVPSEILNSKMGAARL